ncbi:uncharacterized protein LOC119111661 [Pollicipes pollicipes]|uniref:uncharacterized protein LOC119111661 n=1 Tax=Pollicipes pollicipes TaxID=41117 RepID=UPI001885181D|nr:uncharacterized protein LOC119111661 [Pollicipes pollicipes]
MKPELAGGAPAVRPPGSAGRTFLSDRSLELWRDPVGFIARGLQEHGGRAFTTRLLLRPTVVLGDNTAVRHLLADPDTFQCGLRDLFLPLFGENLVFMDGQEAESTRARLHGLFNAETASNYKAISGRVIQGWAEELATDAPLNLYAAFKRLAMDLNLAVFLGLERAERPEQVTAVTEVATTHWHGNGYTV